MKARALILAGLVVVLAATRLWLADPRPGVSSKEFIMAGDGVLEFTDDNFETEVLQSDQPVLVDFWAEWCMPCRMLAPTIAELAGEFEGRVKVGKVDTDANRSVAAKYNIMAIPTVILFRDGKEVSRFQGARPKRDFVNVLESAAAAQ